jgi:hypothetical protein
MRLHHIALPFAALIAVITLAQAAHANVMIIIDKSAQKMTVTVNGEERYIWPVSTPQRLRHSFGRSPALPHGERSLLARMG